MTNNNSDVLSDVCPCSAAGQLSQSAHFSLQLPYTVLGLGRSANFLDHLFVGIPRQPGETVRKNMSGLYNLVTAQSHRLTHGFVEGLKEMQLKREQREE